VSLSGDKRSNRYSNCRVRGRFDFASPTPSPSRQQREQGSADYLADGQSFGRGKRADAPDKAVRKLDGEREFGFAWRDRLFQLASLFEITIGLPRRDGALPGQRFDGFGELIDVLQQIARSIEAFGFLRLAGARHLS
jgi:hypothetical protein